MNKYGIRPGIIPQGDVLLYCINNEIPICEDCGAVMKRVPDNNGGCDVFECQCGFVIDEMDYEYKDPEQESNVMPYDRYN